MQTNPTDLTPKARRTRALLLNAGQKLIGLHGIGGVNVMAVCFEANVGRTSFYNYFDDVDSLVRAVALEAATEIKSNFDHLHRDQPRGLERLKACLKMILTQAVEEPESALLLTALIQTSSEIEDLLFSEIYAELSGMGGFEDKELRLRSTFLTIAVLALVRRFADGRLLTESIDGHLDLLLASVK